MAKITTFRRAEIPVNGIMRTNILSVEALSGFDGIEKTISDTYLGGDLPP